MTTLARTVTAGAVVALLSAPAFAQRVTYDVKGGHDFSQLRTFSFKETPPADVKASQTTAYDSPIVRQNTNAAVAAQLQMRGMSRDDTHPDAYVTSRRTFEKEYYAYGWPGAYGYWGYYGYGSYAFDPVIVGTLTVDIIDAGTGDLLWRGISTHDVHEKSKPDHRLRRVNEEVSKMFRKYPSGTVATSGSETPQPTDR